MPEDLQGVGKLTPTESRLLSVLSGQPGKVFTRAELVALVMIDTIVLPRTIDVHITALRKKLGTRGAQIETVRRVGYRFVADGGAPSEEPIS